MSTDLISRHIFLFPFKWENATDLDNGKSFESRTNLMTFAQNLGLPLEKKGPSSQSSSYTPVSAKPFTWQSNVFSLEGGTEYNEFNYFYDYVREILYDFESSPLKVENTGKSLLKHYELRIADGWKAYYNVNVKVKDKKKEDTYHPRQYVLDLDSVLLNVYDTGVGVISFFLGNRRKDQDAPEDILRINQYGRRLAPPFFAIDPNQVGLPERREQSELASSSEPWDLKKRLSVTQKAELAKSISLSFEKSASNQEEIVPTKHQEDFLGYTEKDSFAKGPFLLPNFIAALFPEGKIITQEAIWRDKTLAHTHVNSILLKPVLDDRMFVLCWYGGKEKVEAEYRQGWPKSLRETNSTIYRDINYSPGEYWFKFLFVDGNSTSTYDREFAHQTLKNHTYTRWAPYSYFGVSRYSLVCLTDSLANLRQPFVNAAFLPQHMESLYYKLFELCIIQRASVLRFADEVTHLSHFTHEEQDAEALFKKLHPQVSELYRHYIRFVNKIYFREITAQDQGIDLYNMLQRELRIEKQVEDLDKEIAELHQYVSLLEQKVKAKGVV